MEGKLVLQVARLVLAGVEDSPERVGPGVLELLDRDALAVFSSRAEAHS